jgi:uncharacterized membrane protein (DUF4010 family)
MDDLIQDDIALLARFGAALFIGILVGLQREYSATAGEELAGVRTFALIALIGCTAPLIGDIVEAPWAAAILLMIPAAFLLAGYAISALKGDIGLTTEMASIMTLMCGTLCYWDYVWLAASLAVTTVVLLSVKLELQQFAHRLTKDDIVAALKFAVITIIILPVLPDRTYGPAPIDVVNPYRTWLMVVLISAMSFLGYVLLKIFGPRQGMMATGLLGGLASSTAMTVSAAQRSRQNPELAASCALTILSAWSVMFLRVLVVVLALSRDVFSAVAVPLIAAAIVCVVMAWRALRRTQTQETADVNVHNPFELGMAIKFGLLYAGILVVVRLAQTQLGDTGIYLSGVLAGVADVDAITLSMVEMSRQGLAVDITSVTIVFATMSNTLFKGAVAWFAGSPAIRRPIAQSTIFIMVVTVLAIGILKWV